jgi:hypothetical protein
MHPTSERAKGWSNRPSETPQKRALSARSPTVQKEVFLRRTLLKASRTETDGPTLRRVSRTRMK